MHDIFTVKKKSLNAIVVKELRGFCCSLQIEKLLWGKCSIQYDQWLHGLRADEENALAVSIVFKGSWTCGLSQSHPMVYQPCSLNTHAYNLLEFSWASPFPNSRENTPPPIGSGGNQSHQQLPYVGVCQCHLVGAEAAPSKGCSWSRAECSRDALLREPCSWET